MVRLLGAKISGDLDCAGGKFSGEHSALSLQKACVAGLFFWKAGEGDRPTGAVNLSSAEVGDLCDDVESWPKDKLGSPLADKYLVGGSLNPLPLSQVRY